MTEEQRKQYKEAAKKYATDFVEKASGIPRDTTVAILCARVDFTAGCEFAHNLQEERLKEEYNRAMDDVENVIRKVLSYTANSFVIEELKKLRK